ncbi:hypothetical protein Hdeb2414_s0001g00017141 [Helianthus debilis subsp. tardiflorus]
MVFLCKCKDFNSEKQVEWPLAQYNRDDAWMRGEIAEQALHYSSFQSSGMFPWIQQRRVDPSFLESNLNQQYQAATMS